MSDQRAVDITELATLGDQFPLRLMQLGFRLMQVMDEAGRDHYRYVIPPTCTVPAGPFLMGSDKQRDAQAQDNEMPQHAVTLEAFEIGAYPLTVAEYTCFVEATNRTAPQNRSSQQHPDRPVVHVSWNDVLAYTRWLAQVTGEGWRLPTEAEWEKAARGIDGRIYPWGDRWDDTCTNTYDGVVYKMTTPVGSYPGGVSPYGAFDMAGNTWEWTSTKYASHPYLARDGREDLSDQTSKVLRGGSWSLRSQYARAASRLSYLPSNSFNALGARLVRRVVVGG